MVVHWRRHCDAHWRKSMFINGLGAALSAIVFLIAGITKFTAGAWLAIVVGEIARCSITARWAMLGPISGYWTGRF
jgi:hypothetical protein